MGAHFLIRGIRDAKDLEYEIKLMDINSELAPEIETIFIGAKVEFSDLSSSYIRYLIGRGFEEMAHRHLPTSVFMICKGEKIL